MYLLLNPWLFSFEKKNGKMEKWKKNQENHWSFYPSEPFRILHFNMRYPVN